ncbi:entericidin A/B family lipoprotein [Azoarcus sp. TTM-91]|uniref:Putative small secreted protein n=1 Tax=Azoarcus indigens TaxID=29545 RepID=A0A4R6DV06_9RHOO|nr:MULTISPECIES: entericidin A/B family lipoprotein [Azoarcus]NMG36386.1 entericidin A/B family lipoprotein [Azoarcus sp. TTM-91]NMG66559.1 entericidin A/B family lipoprotein [Azoarcus indigens]TDN48138.1 putative small secreted protein [Azoarcus indigens]
MKAIIALIAAAFVISGCNTVAGAGKDIERGGEAIQNKAKEVQRGS